MYVLCCKFDTPFESIPFSKIKPAAYQPALESEIALARGQIEQIIQNQATPNFENTLVALENAGEPVSRIATLFFNLHAAAGSPEMQQVAEKLTPMLTTFQSDISLNEGLFKRIQAVYDKRKNLNLTPEQRELLRKTYLHFSRSGAGLKAEDKSALRKIEREIAQHSLAFGTRVLQQTDDFTLEIKAESDLEGLPEDARETAAAEARKRGKEGWVFTLQAPSYLAFMTYVKNRALRERLCRAFTTRAARGGESDNRETVLKIAKLREKRAKLLGYDSFADFVLERRMAENPQTVQRFLEELLSRSYPVAQREMAGLQALAQAEGITRLQYWDSYYYAEKYKRKNLALDEEKLKEYFALDHVIQGAFDLANELYGIVFKQTEEIEKYHDEVLTYQVSEATGRFLALLYLDLFPRTGKRAGAWMTSFRDQCLHEGKDQRPQVSIVCNFSRPTKEKPALLRFEEVTTLFHEFGHALHAMLSAVTYASLSGTQVYRDFVELPSQLMENWCYETEALNRFARHYKTGNPMPLEMRQKLKALRHFLTGYKTVRQLRFAILDMGWHARNLSEVRDVFTYEEALLEATELYPKVEGANTSCSFSHIFQGGYAAGYYAYKWAEALDADAFELFRQQGIFNKDVAQRFREHILSKGGSAHPMVLYKRFRGHEPSLEPLLKRSGLQQG